MRRGTAESDPVAAAGPSKLGCGAEPTIAALGLLFLGNAWQLPRVPRYEYQDSKSHKFWEIERKGKKLNVRYGKVGSEGQKRTKELSSTAEAQREYDSLIKAKQKKGYVLEGKAPSAPAPSLPTFERDPKQEAQIEQSPKDIDLYLVYADWLEMQGDPRGQLIEVQAQLLKKPDDKSLVAAERNLFKKHAAHFFGPDHSDDPEEFAGPKRNKRSKSELAKGLPHVYWSYGYFLSIDWWCGYVERLHFDPGYYQDDKSGQECVQILKRFLSNPSARFIQHLSVGDIWANDIDDQYRPDLTLVLQVLKNAPCAKHLKHLEFCGGENDISGVDLDASQVSKICPNLEQLQVYGGSITLGKIDLPHLHTFSAYSGSLSASAVRAIGRARWPKLRSLKVLFGSHYYGADASVKDLKPIFSGQGLQNLEHLGLCNAEFGDRHLQSAHQVQDLASAEDPGPVLGHHLGSGRAHAAESRGLFCAFAGAGPAGELHPGGHAQGPQEAMRQCPGRWPKGRSGRSGRSVHLCRRVSQSLFGAAP